MRTANAMKMAMPSRSSPARVGPAAVMEGRFWLCGARKSNGYSHANQHTMSATQAIRIILVVTCLDTGYRITLRRHHDLTELLFIFEAFVRRADFGERVDPVNYGIKLFPEDEFQH